MKTGSFSHALVAERCWFELGCGERIELPVHRWREASRVGDELLLESCAGPTIDVGCGPGRLTAALAERGINALGIDCSPTAVRLARQRGAVALRRDVFDRVPGEGRWHTAVLADGNIGIGGDPVALLNRVAELISGEGRVLVELEPPGSGLRHEQVRLHTAPGGVGNWFTWAWLSTDAVAGVARAAGLRVNRITSNGQRYFAELS